MFKSASIRNAESRYKEIAPMLHGDPISRVTFQRRIKQLRSLGWIKEWGDCIRLISESELPKQSPDKKGKWVGVWNNKEFNMTYLRSLVIHFSEREQRYRIAQKNFTVKTTLLKRKQGDGSYSEVKEETSESVNISCRKMTELFGRKSPMVAWRHQRKATIKGLIRVNNRLGWRMNQFVTNIKGEWWSKLSNEIETLINPKKLYVIRKMLQFQGMDKVERAVCLYTNDCYGE